jgi:hypothetical protein
MQNTKRVFRYLRSVICTLSLFGDCHVADARNDKMRKYYYGEAKTVVA